MRRLLRSAPRGAAAFTVSSGAASAAGAAGAAAVRVGVRGPTDEEWARAEYRAWRLGAALPHAASARQEEHIGSTTSSSSQIGSRPTDARVLLSDPFHEKGGHAVEAPAIVQSAPASFRPDFKRVEELPGGAPLVDKTATCRVEAEFTDFVLVGSGGFANVFRVASRLDGRNYALKVQRCRALTDEIQEARCMASLPPHPSLVRYHTAWIDDARCARLDAVEAAGEESDEESEEEEEGDGDSTLDVQCVARRGSTPPAAPLRLFIQMEYCDAPTLQAVLQRECETGVRAPPQVRWRWVGAIADALSVLHERGWAHLDIKPANIFCQPTVPPSYPTLVWRFQTWLAARRSRRRRLPRGATAGRATGGSLGAVGGTKGRQCRLQPAGVGRECTQRQRWCRAEVPARPPTCIPWGWLWPKCTVGSTRPWSGPSLSARSQRPPPTAREPRGPRCAAKRPRH